MNKYVFRFGIVTVVSDLVRTALEALLKREFGAGFVLASALAASMFAAYSFAKDHDREPSPEEKHEFAWRAVGVYLASAFIMAAITVLITPLAGVAIRQLFTGSFLSVAIPVCLIASVIYYRGIRWVFGRFARLSVERWT
ncbi:ABZJ_00895 family protein [Caenimonas aquaedulcis]|uniref:Uncharacterized protein n=1 Tax=Caenimonas aquaedulcis TaxID=2793270 RepID=A0A931MFS4_9BURK|nr:ABZJ_00895 family protein [Caenimonas aquaedulcis]MBG9387422.1 hypothetical protein [Caenimonas aquaedulcis]